ncbi:ATP-binding protein [Sporosarcina sp. HYO08]|uniref:ATP-binding protein n=1 Tax=Sporosarcina sp. HYO08 TaxID=1759557 RepID=UPI00079975CE|nr:ATP-binding protein [Sporosarcina sp. HYO08]KXH87338.1 hypothetical protein AU377_01820 [Sporosarcina sp. HYO08]
MLETLLINALFLIFPIMIYLIFIEDHKNQFNHIVVFFSVISMVLCMLFPVKLEVGYIVDLRYIPFAVLALYGGYKKVFPLYIVLNVVRFFIGGDGVIESFLYSTVFFLIVPLLSKKFNRMGPKQRVVAATSIAVLNVCIYLSQVFYLYKGKLHIFRWLAIDSILTTATGMLFVVLLCEKIRSNIESRKMYVHSEKLEVLSELSASIAHEIRNPLTVTNGFLQLLKGSKSLSPEEKAYIDYSLDELQRAESIVSDFLAYSKPQSIHMVTGDFKEDIEYVGNIMKPYANTHRVKIQTRFSNTLQKDYDQNQLRQCLLNLYKNGIEAMKETGGILSIDVFERKKQIIIQIGDTGIGMTEEEIEQLGDPYYSTKKEGTGLGMLMVYSIVHSLKGKIDVKSKKGKGTTFRLIIPV